jgi:hypothetical protein
MQQHDKVRRYVIRSAVAILISVAMTGSIYYLAYFVVRVEGESPGDFGWIYWVSIPAGLFYFAFAGHSPFRYARSRLDQDVQLEPSGLDDQLAEARQTLRSAGSVLSRLEAQIAAREALVSELASRTEHLRVAATLHEDTAQKVGAFLTAELRTQLEEMHRAGLRNSLMSFIGGILVSIPIGVLINVWTR